MKKIILFIIAVLVLIFIARFAFQAKNIKQPVAGNTAEKQTEAVTSTVKFTDPVSKETVTVIFDQTNNKATISGLSFQNLDLSPAVSGSGA